MRWEEDQAIADAVDQAFREQLSPWRRIGEIAAGVTIALLVVVLVVGLGAAVWASYAP